MSKLIMKILKFLMKPILKLTRHSKAPTDPLLDVKIATLKFNLHDIFEEISFIIKVKWLRFFKYGIYRFIWKSLILIGILLGVASLSWLIWYAMNKPTQVYIWKTADTEIIDSYPNDTSMTLKNFLLQIQYIESKNIYHANRDEKKKDGSFCKSEYWGVYQLGNEARKVSGYGDISREVFLKHPEIQEMCMINFMKYNKKIMQPFINKYSGKIIGGILVTESGILAMSHQGVGNACNYLTSKGKIVGGDGYGTPCTTYLKLGGYKLNLDKIESKLYEIKE